MSSRPAPPQAASRRALSLLPLGLCAALLAAAQLAAPDDRVVVGEGEHAYRWTNDWARLPEGVDLGATHGGVAVDAGGNVYVTTESERAVLVFGPEGELVRSFGKDLAGGLHGICVVQEDEGEFLYLAHTARHEVIKTDLEGRVLWTLGPPANAEIYSTPEQYKPTGVAVAPDGSIYVADGYGKSWVHQFDRARNYVRSWGGPGGEPGRMNTPHGICLDRRSPEPTLIVCDRENHRLQHFDLEGNLLGVTEGMLRRPCNVSQRGEFLVVADLAGRVTVLNGKNELVVHLGDNPDPARRANFGVERDAWRDGEFLSPHGAAWDAAGNLIVQDWNRWGRITKLLHDPQPSK